MRYVSFLVIMALAASAAAQPRAALGPGTSGSAFAAGQAGQAAAGTSTSQAAIPLTLEEAIAQGVANSQRLAELQVRGEAADYAIAGRRAADMPAVSVQGGYTRTNHVEEFSVPTTIGRPPQVLYPDVPDNFRTRLDMQWPIYSGGRNDALERAARAERSAAGNDLDAARADLRLEITRAYWAVVTARDAESVLKRSLEAITAHVGDVRSRFASGLIPPNDVSSSEAQAAHQRLLALEAANQRGIAEADLRRLTGNDAATAATPGSTAAALPPPPAWLPPPGGSLAELIGAALKARPERQALEARAESAAERANAAGSSARPQVAVAAGYDYARPNPRIFPRSADWKPTWDASVNVSWSLWDGGRRGAEQGEALANASALRTRVGDFDRQVTFEVRARALELDSSREAVAAADEELRAAAEAERAIGERYRAGVATSTDVLDAQVARLQAELDRTRAIANVRLAEARLERAVGR
jgi:outer membrane protein